MNNFQFDYEKAKKSVKDEDIDYTQNYIQYILVPYIKKMQKENPNLNTEEFEELLYNEFLNFSETAFESSTCADYYIEYICCKYFREHPKVLENMLKNFNENNKDRDKNKYLSKQYHTFDDYLVRYLYSANSCFKGLYNDCKILVDNNLPLKQIADDPNLSVKEKFKKTQDFLNKCISSKHERDSIMKYLKYYIGGLKSYLDFEEQMIPNQLQKILITSISEIAKQLSKLGLLDTYSKRELENFKEMGLEDFVQPKNCIDITNPELLKKLSIHDLMILNSFWINRYAKELECLCNGMFCIDTLNVLPKILDDSFSNSDINSYFIEETLIKCKMLRPHAEHFITIQQQDYLTGKLRKKNYTEIENKNYIIYSFVPFAKKINSRYGINYERNFNLTLKNSYNNVNYNALLYGKYISPVINMYDTKNDIINALICNINDNNQIVNAGIIPDKISKDGTHIKQLDPNLVYIGLDTNLTFPVRVHILFSNFKNFLLTLKDGDVFVPLYEGAKDFTYPNGDNFPAQRVMPFSKNQEKFIKKFVASNSTGISNDFALHLNWLRDSSCIPDKFKASKEDFKGRIKKFYVRKFINLNEYEIGKPLSIYVNENGKYIKLSDSGYIFSKDINSCELTR